MMLIEHGLDKPAPTLSRPATRQKFSLPQNAPLLLNVGRLVAQKNQDVLIRALADAPTAHLAIAGDGGNADSYRALASELGVSKRLHLLGALSPDDVANLYAASDLFVFPSIWETFGLAAVEAAMVGLPAVVADLPVLREVLWTGSRRPVDFVAPDDVAGWTAAINTALDARPAPELVARFATAITQKYSRQRMIESYVGLLKSAAAAA
jgi:glycosyltransferase involved in cell wall biosynthesis